MIKVSTLFYRVDGFNGQHSFSTIPVLLDHDSGDQFLENLLSPLVIDPGESLVKTIFEKI